MGLDEVIESGFYDLRVVVFEYHGEEGAYGHKFPTEEEEYEVVGGEEQGEAEECGEESEVVEGELPDGGGVVVEVGCAVECAYGEEDTYDGEEVGGERVGDE